jgi:hypothetical protein
MKARKMTCVEIAGKYGKPVTAADISRILHNVFPKNQAKREALGLSPICVTCYRRIPRPITINKLLHLPIQDMPAEILKLALHYRE